MASNRDGDNLTAGQSNSAQSGTELVTNSRPLNDDHVLRVREANQSPNVVAVHGIASGVGGQGIRGEGGEAGVEGRGETGVRGLGTKVGVEARGYIGLEAGGPESTAGIIAAGSEIGIEGVGPTAVLAAGDQYGLVAIGSSAGAVGQSRTFGVLGQGTGTSGPVGVCGQTRGGIGVLGTSQGVGVYAHSDGAFGLWAEGGTGAFSGAAFLAGNVYVVGDLLVFGGLRSGAVRHPDKSHRTAYGIDSTESWFEDFGEAELIGGKAKVALQADFLALIDRKHYHVFVAAYGDSQGLYVARRTASGFEVRERQGGKSRLRFSYRIVAKRKDVKGVRLQKIVLPAAPAKLPKVPKPPSPERLSLRTRKGLRGKSSA